MYKTILVHADQGALARERMEVASRLAKQFEAHLVGAAMTGLSSFAFPITSIDASMPPIVFPVEELRGQANLALDEFDKTANQEAVDSFERRLVDDEAGMGLCLQARYSDLVVITQKAPGKVLPLLRPDFVDYVLLNSARPVLVLPHSGLRGEVGRSISLAWNGSTEALRAITGAIPFLKRAHKVDLIVLNANSADGDHGEEPGADMALYLVRHGVKVEVTVATSGMNDGEALLSCAAAKNADMLVMGAYGHSRFQEVVLGGATRTALSAAPVALLLSH